MAYVGIGGPFSVVKTLFAGVLFWFMVKFSFGRGLLTQVQYHLKNIGLYLNCLKKNRIYTIERHELLIQTHEYQLKCVFLFSLLVSRIFLIWFVFQVRTVKKAGTIKMHWNSQNKWLSPYLFCWRYIWCLSAIVVVFQMDGTSFCLRFMGEGYTTGQDPSLGKPNATINTEITGPGIVLVIWFDTKYSP